MTAVREWLAVGQAQEEDHQKYRDIRNTYKETGKWILKNSTIKDWIDADSKGRLDHMKHVSDSIAIVPNSPIVWLAGMPGAGQHCSKL